MTNDEFGHLRTFSSFGFRNSSLNTVLLHICCAPCATSVVETLQNEGYEIIGCFYNPNIHPETEYKIRLREVENFASKISFPILTGIYKPKIWFEQTKGLENAPEGGERCKICYKLRLDYTAKLALKKGYNAFTTTLTVSPHKPANIISSIGKGVGERYGIEFLTHDFKKKDGFKRSVELSQKYNLYRQSYCGCIFSMKNTKHRNI